MPSIKLLSHFSPGRIIFYSLIITILLGTIGLSLPIARTAEISFIDLIFTATSSACVTGSYTVPLEDFTTFGHIIIMILIQIGGIGLITLTIFLLSFFMEFGFAQQVMIGQLLEIESWKNIRTLIIFIIISTLCIEALAALAMYPFINALYPAQDTALLSIFHAISSFCNAGVSLFPDGLETFGNNYFLLLITGLLMILGGLGFVTWREIIYYIRSLHQKKRFSFSLHSKIILYGTFFIISFGTILFWILEHNNTYGQMGYLQSIVHATFQAVSFRNGGFSLIPINLLSLPTLFITLFIMFIGASPLSTGSGIKITTVALFLATVKATISDRASVDIKGRQIANDQVHKAITIIALSSAWICLTILFLLITETGWSFFTILFETISAFSNVGITTGLTKNLTCIGKIFIMLNMIIGRIGSLTLLLALRQFALKNAHESTGFTYPEERVMLG